MRSILCCSAVLPFIAVCGGKGQPVGLAGANPQNDQFCYGWVSSSGGWTVSMVAVFAKNINKWVRVRDAAHLAQTANAK